MARVGELMSTRLVVIGPDATVAEAATVMARRKVGSVLVMTGEELAGIFTERDVVRAISHDIHAPQDEVSHWMTREPTTIDADTAHEAALELMRSGHFRHLPVVAGRKVVGMLSMRDLIKAGAAVG
ncbi:MAG: CBS domain-containing protein [Chloroflexi bacterium]|nr:MAG: CBS domain-containing protein [Chloroflexota bacterium]